MTQARVVRSEWTKLRALRSTWWCGLTAVVLIVGVGAAVAGSGTAYHVSAGDSAAAGISAALLGVLIAQLVLGVIAVLAFSGEYGTGMIRATLAVVPSRLPVLWAKLIVLAGLVLPVTLLCAIVDFFAATAIESSRGGSAISLTDPGVLRTVLGSSLYLTVVVIIGLTLGALLRKTAAGLSVFAAVFFVIPVVVGTLPHTITGFQRLEREHDQTSALAAAVERARIAREMHDSVAHHLTVIVALSDGAPRADLHLAGADPGACGPDYVAI